LGSFIRAAIPQRNRNPLRHEAEKNAFPQTVDVSAKLWGKISAIVSIRHVMPAHSRSKNGVATLARLCRGHPRYNGEVI
jgi:hypothetical protein